MNRHEVRWGEEPAAETAAMFIDEISRASAADPAATQIFSEALISVLRFYDRQTHAPMHAIAVQAFERTVLERLSPFKAQIAQYVSDLSLDASYASDEDQVMELRNKRSVIQIILDKYPALGSEISHEVVAALDADLRRVCIEYPMTRPDAVPHGITGDHWWWNEEVTP